MREALTRFDQIYGTDGALLKLHEALLAGSLIARAARTQARDIHGGRIGGPTVAQIIKPNEWLGMMIIKPEQGQAVRKEHGGDRTYFDIRVSRSDLDSIVGAGAENSSRPNLNGRPVQEARFEVAIRVARKWVGRSADERRSASVKSIAQEVAAELKRREMDAPESAVMAIAAAIRRELRAGDCE